MNGPLSLKREQFELTRRVDYSEIRVGRLHLFLYGRQFACDEVVGEDQGTVWAKRVLGHYLLEVDADPDVDVGVIRQREDTGVEVDGDRVLRLFPVPAHER